MKNLMMKNGVAFDTEDKRLQSTTFATPFLSASMHYR
jgi:hypothetical protein